MLAEVSPHPLAFASNIFLWIYVMVVSVINWFFFDGIISWARNFALVGKTIAPLMPYVLEALLICIPFLIYSIAKVTWKYFVLALVLTVVQPIVLQVALGISPTYAFITTALVGLVAVVVIDVHRRAHKYIITDRRIIFVYNGLLKKTRRDVVYSRIADLILEKGFFGKIFNFGNILPLSQSGLGLGEDLAALTAGVGGGKGAVGGVAVTGGRTVKVPRSRSFYILYGVPRPEELYDLMVSAMKASEEAPYLKELVEKFGESK